jgi:GntR family transcriptional regulator
MEFRDNQAIYLQIADLMSENILAGAWEPKGRIPSIREMAESIQVNPNTVMRTYAYMENKGIIQNERGIGFFLAENAYDTTRDLLRRGFETRDLPRVWKTMDLLRMSFDDLRGLHAAYRDSLDKEKAV